MDVETDVDPRADYVLYEASEGGVFSAIDPWKFCTIDDFIDEAGAKDEQREGDGGLGRTYDQASTTIGTGVEGGWVRERDRVRERRLLDSRR